MGGRHVLAAEVSAGTGGVSMGRYPFYWQRFLPLPKFAIS